MNARAALLTWLALAGCATSVQPTFTGPATVRPPDLNCDGSELTNLDHYEIHYGRESRVRAGFSAAGSCYGPGLEDFSYANVVEVAARPQDSCTLMLGEAGMWYVSAVAVTSSGRKSRFSNEAPISVSEPGPYTLRGCTRAIAAEGPLSP